ncbi:hypothetical protein EC849_11796 [Pseudomonas putida]|uniref:hypothetical protein n=1 Tax=Pseudomonas putida TaxID=303 RepID=UPI0010467EB7|nr:hypothetical protein [Pseudomonas putida]TCP73409.1 hypothetical protein EC849_11796 [Pseudomonas putida]
MNEFTINLRRVMLLEGTLEHGGSATCPLRRPETIVDAHIQVENDDRDHHLQVRFGPFTGSITLRRGDSTKYMSLRDFLQDVANGRTESGQQIQRAIALMEALDCVTQVLPEGLHAYITPTPDEHRPFGTVVTNDQGEVYATAYGSCKTALAEAVRTKLGQIPVGRGEHP